jgi:hypothetical protein
VQGGDRRLHEVRAAAVEGQRPVKRSAALGDLRLVPERSVLLGQQDELAAAEARLAARVEQQHERQEGVYLRLVGHQLGERPAEP